MMRALVIFLALLLLASPVEARDDLPWPLPDLPLLESPTPMPTINMVPTEAVPTETPDGPTPTITPTPIPTNNLSEILGERIGTLEAIVNATPVPVDGVDLDEQIGTLEEGAGMFISYLRGAFLIHFGVLQPLFMTLVLWFGLILAVKSSAILVPMIALLFGLLRKLVEFVIKFIPGIG